MSEVGDLIRQGLKDAGRYQASVARATGISTKHINQLVQGESRLSVLVAVLLEIEVPTLSAEALLIAQVRDEIADCVKKINQGGVSK